MIPEPTKATLEQTIDVLTHFNAVRDLSIRLEAAGATQAFCELALALHERGLDWWITEAGGIHAGRTEDFRVWQVALALRVDVGAEVTRVAMSEPGELNWQRLDDELVGSLVESISSRAALLPLCTREGYWPDDYDTMSERLVITLTDGAIRNGYLKIPKLQRLFPEECWGGSEQSAQVLFTLGLPDGSTQQTQLLTQYMRIQARFQSLFSREQLKPGDQAVIARLADYSYKLAFKRAGQMADAMARPSSPSRRDEGMSEISLNQILFGPPGTGKTYATIEAALEVLDPASLQQQLTNRTALKQRFDELAGQDRIRFVTFHQSFSYEDFVEGLRATTDEGSGELRYEVVGGVFKSLCEAAAAKVTQQAEAPVDIGKRRIWKMSLGNTQGSDAAVYEECVQGGYMLLGYGGGIDFTGCKNRGDVQQRFIDAGVNPDGPYDYSVTSVTAFVTKMKSGDLVVVSDGNFKFRAIGEVAGDYAFKIHPEYDPHYSQMRSVKWLRQYSPSLPHSELLNGQFSQMTLYELRSPTLNREKLQGLLGTPALAGVFVPGQTFGRDYQVIRATAELLELKKPNGNVLGFSMSLINELAEAVRSEDIELQDIRDKTAIEKLPGSTLEPYLVNGYNSILAVLVGHLTGTEAHKPATEADTNARVLIIDEINRGNISRIFGELITLIEPSKRAGADEVLSVVLPYSKQPFSVPKNVYLIGTMNTADRSLAGLDIALRRRFTFREMPPKPELLDDVRVQGLSIGQLLRVVNQRIEVLLDRDHCLGHAYFMPLKDDSSLERLEGIFRNQILPLLQEYFFEDWERIQWVLNDHRKPLANQFVNRKAGNVELLFGQDVGQGLERNTWCLNDDAFERLESYMGVVDHQLQSVDVGEKRKASHGDLLLRELSTGSIEVWRGEVLQQPTKPLLRDLAGKLGVNTFNDSGSPLNTRALGRRLIDQLGSGNA